jgi:hypothetical protein
MPSPTKTLQFIFEEEKLTQDVLKLKAEESKYYESACHFILDNWDEPIDRLSPKQKNWAEMILEDLTEQRIEGRL